MATSVNRATYSYRINDYATPTSWSTSGLFDVNFIESTESPIDTFIRKLVELNKLILDGRDLTSRINSLHSSGTLDAGSYATITSYISDTTNLPSVHANLVLLGYISAVESYFREIIRRVIIIDDISRKACEPEMITFGAALFHHDSMLPEALLESISFINKKNIKEVIKQFLGITTVGFPNSVEDSLTEFENICQLRHCIVHRFGKLGANNAIKLGLDSHGSFIEKPIKLDYTAIQKVAQVCFNTVKEVNQFLWQVVMMRQIADPINNKDWKKKTTVLKWTWDLRKDKKNFKTFFDTFASTNGTTITPDLNTAYTEFKNRYNTLT